MHMTQEPLVSVVTPAYNAERFLRQCIESVLAQTYANWDYTIVNNRSTDRTLEIAREYAATDSRIRVVDNEHHVRVIENHNIAARQISRASKYCKFVAADDWLFPECLAEMVRLAEAHPSVAMVGAYGIFGSRVTYNGLPYPSTVMPGKELCRRYMLGEFDLVVFGVPTSLLYRSDIVRSRHAFYNEDNLHADSEACFEFLENRDFGFVHQVLVYHRERPGSLTAGSREMNTYLPGSLNELIRFGPVYLTEDELAALLRQKLDNYYWYLSKQVFESRGEEFWRYHRAKLAKLGHPLSKPRLVGQAILELGIDGSKKALSATAKGLRYVLSKLG
jgi:glycosyltransferase involved in cell wall biosynthesis